MKEMARARMKTFAEQYWANVRRQLAYYDISLDELAAAACCSKGTIYNYAKRPETIPLKKMERISNKLGIKVTFDVMN